MNADGSNEVKLVDEAEKFRDFVLSPNGQQIALATNENASGGGEEIYVINADGSNKRSLNQKGAAPLWSPDGKWIAFSSRPDKYIHNVFVMRSDGDKVLSSDNRVPNCTRASIQYLDSIALSSTAAQSFHH